MQLEELRLRNWCQHKDLTLQFRPGLNGILGANGIGKSNVLDAVRFLFCGESINCGNKKDNLTWGEDSGYVWAAFTVDGTRYEIKRSIETSRSELKWGDQKLTSATEIEHELTRILANPTVLHENVFVPQGKINSILYARATDRLKEFQESFGLTRAADAHKWLSQEANAYQLTPGLDKLLVQTTDLTLESRKTLKQATDELAVTNQRIDALTPAEEVLREAIEATKTQQTFRQAKDSLDKAHRELATRQLATDAAKDLTDRLTAQKRELEPKADQTMAELTELTNLTLKWYEATTHRTKLAELNKQRGALGIRPSNEDLDTLQTRYHQLKAQADKFLGYIRDPKTRPKMPNEDAVMARGQLVIREDINAQTAKWETPEIHQLDQDISRAQQGFDGGICPTCGQEVEGGPAAAEKRKEHLGHLVARREALAAPLVAEVEARKAAAKTAYKAFEAEVDALEQLATKVIRDQYETTEKTRKQVMDDAIVMQKRMAEFDQLDRQIDVVSGQLAGCPATKPDADRVATLKLFQDEYATLVIALDKASTDLRIAQAALKDAAARHDEATQFLKDIGQAIQMPSDEAIADAQVKVMELSVRRAKVVELAQTIGTEQAKLAQCEAEAKRLGDQINQEAKMAAWVTEVKKVRDALHVTNLPATTMREFARVINSQMEFYLTTWEAPFRVWLDQSMAFQAQFHGGPVFDAARLSGGQQVVASVSFRLAMSDTFANQVGLLVLDEPSNHLDAVNKQHLQALLLQLKTLSTHSGRQILIVTHEGPMMGFFDHVVEIK